MENLGIPDGGLVNATLNTSCSAVYSDGSQEEPRSLTVPFMTMSPNDYVHLVIRDARGAQVDYLPSSGRSDVLLDFQLPAMFLKSGTWTFSIEARLGDESNACLFAMTLTQWLDGGL